MPPIDTRPDDGVRSVMVKTSPAWSGVEGCSAESRDRICMELQLGGFTASTASRMVQERRIARLGADGVAKIRQTHVT